MKTDPSHIRNRMILFLSLIGAATAAYVLQSFLRGASILCINTGCEMVRKHPASSPFGVPVPLFGLVGYSIIAVSAFAQSLDIPEKWRSSLRLLTLGVSVFGVGFVSWFTYVELFLIGAVCTWCALSAGTMVLIFALAYANWRNKKEEAA